MIARILTAVVLAAAAPAPRAQPLIATTADESWAARVLAVLGAPAKANSLPELGAGTWWQISARGPGQVRIELVPAGLGTVEIRGTPSALREINPQLAAAARQGLVAWARALQEVSGTAALDPGAIADAIAALVAQIAELRVRIHGPPGLRSGSRGIIWLEPVPASPLHRWLDAVRPSSVPPPDLGGEDVLLSVRGSLQGDPHSTLDAALDLPLARWTAADPETAQQRAAAIATLRAALAGDFAFALRDHGITAMVGLADGETLAAAASQPAFGARLRARLPRAELGRYHGVTFWRQPLPRTAVDLGRWFGAQAGIAAAVAGGYWLIEIGRDESAIHAAIDRAAASSYPRGPLGPLVWLRIEAALAELVAAMSRSGAGAGPLESGRLPKAAVLELGNTGAETFVRWTIP